MFLTFEKKLVSLGDLTSSCLTAESYSIQWGPRATLQNNAKAHLLIQTPMGRRPGNVIAAEFEVLAVTRKTGKHFLTGKRRKTLENT